ncbi:glutathione-dependent formaldehyde-activating enzyme centromere V [Fusarium pseudoanthophilum]|uniref:Glutathione-dependent formaldehyde-activating enzyme centromere V n=1 Tax=Fusarium pseudoanthophilum TaxID=48495 RepID=A0A8H5P6A8_9HYPO|nr:glutathione-dependent formaldehyde-activating enzyme centromere V [Fusarium pseudoanthophilum]
MRLNSRALLCSVGGATLGPGLGLGPGLNITNTPIGKFTAQDVKVSTTAEDAITKYSLSDTSSGSSKEKGFCRTCGCTLWTIPAAAKGKFYMIRLPLLDGGLNFQPANEIFVRNRPTWVEPVKDAGQWDEMRK